MNITQHRIIVVALIVLVVFTVSRINCIFLKIGGLPDLLRENDRPRSRWLFLFGGNICTTCPIGEFIFKAAKADDISFVFPYNTGNTDIDNFRRVFLVKGQIITEVKLDKFYMTVCRCLKKYKKTC